MTVPDPWWYKPTAECPYRWEDAYPWDKEWEKNPIHWKGFVVIGDRHLPDGKRQHLVRGSVPNNTVINNADIIGEDDDVKFVDYLEKLK